MTAALVCWNHERYVRSAVLSVLNQTYSNIELLVVDNGSTDGSRRELLSLQEKHGFTLICQENVGLVRALNQVLSIARGEYFSGLATDDVWLLDKVARQVEFLDTHPDVDLVSGQVTCIDSDGRPIQALVTVRPGEATFSDLMARGNSVYGATVMCRTSTLQALGGFDESLRIEDYSLALRLTHERRRVVVLPDVFTLYRRHQSNWTNNSIDRELQEIGERYRNTPEYRGFYRYHFPLHFWHLVKLGRKREALRLLWAEPVPHTWENLGRGLVRLLIPYGLVRAYRVTRGRPADGDPLA